MNPTLHRLNECISTCEREEYQNAPWRPSSPDPLEALQDFFRRARVAGDPVNEVCLSTACDTVVSSRMVLVHHFDSEGCPVFFTGTGFKTRDIEENPSCSILWYWPKLRLQVRLEGLAEELSLKECLPVWKARPLSARATSLAYPGQSDCLGDLTSEYEAPVDLCAKAKEAVLRAAGRLRKAAIPWRGFRIEPNRWEFWVGRPWRCHDRWSFRSKPFDAGYAVERLSP